MKTSSKALLLFILTYGIAACTVDTNLKSIGGSSNNPPTTPGGVVAMDPSGITLGDIKAEDVQSVIADGTPGVFAVEPAAEGIKLVPKQNVVLIAGAIYQIIVKTAKADTTYTIKAEMPAGAIMAFNGTTCPTGWSVFDGAKGRVLVGAGSGNTDADGSLLTSRTFGQAGGREFTTGIPAIAQEGGVQMPSTVLHLAGGKVGANPAKNYASGTPDTTLSGDKADSNMMPFAVILYCQKN